MVICVAGRTDVVPAEGNYAVHCLLFLKFQFHKIALTQADYFISYLDVSSSQSEVVGVLYFNPVFTFMLKMYVAFSRVLKILLSMLHVKGRMDTVTQYVLCASFSVADVNNHILI